MAFALSMVTLDEAMKKPGCPVCRLGHQAAIRSIDTLLWENTNDPGARKPINDAYGFCPPHTRMLVAMEMSTSGPVLGVNIIYELLAKNVSQELKQINQKDTPWGKARSLLDRLKTGLKNRSAGSLLQPKAPCPVCEQVELSCQNVIATIFQELSAQNPKTRTAYEQSDGLCLRHLQLGLTHFMEKYPVAADFIIQDRIRRLDRLDAQMKEYIRKQNWAYRNEALTPEERIAWQRTLTFFTGYPPQRFNHHIDEF